MGTDTTDRILAATHRALCTHGYADLTTERIAAEADVSKAAIHYHYDTKEALLRAYLEYLLEGFESRMACESADPDERLETFLETVFSPDRDGDDFAIALLEIKAQAPYTDPYRTRLRALDERLRETVASAVRDGLESGRYAECDPDAVARFVVTLVDGAHVRAVALGEPPDRARELAREFLNRRLARNGEVLA